MKRASPRPIFITRLQAANLLRAARSTDLEHAGERIGWALAAMKDSRHAQRLKVDHLLSIENFDAADAMLARHLLTGREHPLMRLRFARSMYLQGRHEAAATEIERVLAERPQHVGAMSLAARIATARGDHRHAAELLLMACDLRPGRGDLAALLVEALLGAGMIVHAERLLHTLRNPPAYLVARLMRRQGRIADAASTLTTALGGTLSPSATREAFLELIELHESTGQAAELAAVAVAAGRDARLGAEDRRSIDARAQTARARIGQIDQGSPAANSAILVGTTFQGPVEAAEQALHSINHGRNVVDTPAMARQWLGGLFDLLLQDQSDARIAGADPSPSQLPGMMRSALTAVEARLADAGISPDARERLNRHRTTLLRAMGDFTLNPASRNQAA